MAKLEPWNDPANPSAAYEIMYPKWTMIETLLGGTAAMREAGEEYLPRHPMENQANYDIRLEGAVLTNYTELTLDSLTGKPFSDPLKLNDDVPAPIVEAAEDIDLQGNSLHTFCRAWFREGLAKSFAHVLIEFPTLSAEEQEGRTHADDLTDKRRPYWVMIKPENVIFMASEVIKGVEVLTHVRILETATKTVGFAEECVERVRALYPGEWVLWEKQYEDKVKKTKPKWVIVDQGTFDLPIIPLVTFYANRKSLAEGKPPLEDLAFINTRHWQSTADQNSILTVARFPILAVAGGGDPTTGQMAITPKTILATKDPVGKFYYVEHSGDAIEAGAKDLEKLEQDMAAYGAEFLRKKPGGTTATSRALDSAEATSPLQDMTLRFMDAVAQALSIHAMWIDLDDGGTIELPTDFGPEDLKDVDLRTLNEMRRNRDISYENFITELQRRGLLVDDFDVENNRKQLREEMADPIISPFATGFNVDGSADAQTENSLKDKAPGKSDAPERGAPAKKAKKDKARNKKA